MAIDAVAIAEHVEALLHGDDISKTNAALKIWLSLSAAESSSDAKEQQLVVAMAGAIPLLVRLVRSGSDSAKCNASGALAKLTAVHIREEVCTAIAAAGGVALFVSLQLHVSALFRSLQLLVPSFPRTFETQQHSP